MSGVLAQLGIALALTVVIELAVVALLGGRTSRELVAVTAVNVVTNPVFNAALLLSPSTLEHWLETAVEMHAELDEKGGGVKGIAAAPTRGASGDKQSAHFGSTGEDFAIAQRLLP